MTKKGNIPNWAWKVAIVSATMVWGGSFVVLKGALEAMTPGWLLAIRFALSSVVLALLFRKRLVSALDGSHLVAGMVLGLSQALAYLTQNIGLTHTTPGRNAFLTATYCVMVPFMWWVCERRRPRVSHVVAAVLALVGVGLISLKDEGGFALGIGELMTLLGAFFFAVNIVLVAYFAPAHDMATLTTMQLVGMALSCLAYALLVEPVPHFASLGTNFWGGLVYVVMLATVYGTVVQNFAEAHVEPAQASLLLSLESVFGVVFSVIFYGEVVTLPTACGFAVVFVSILVSELGGLFVRPRAGRGGDEGPDRGSDKGLPAADKGLPAAEKGLPAEAQDAPIESSEGKPA